MENIRITYEMHLKYSRYLYNVGDFEKLMEHSALMCEHRCNSPYEPDYLCNVAIYKYFLFKSPGNEINGHQKTIIVSHLSDAIKQKEYSLNIKFVASVFKILLEDDEIFPENDQS